MPSGNGTGKIKDRNGKLIFQTRAMSLLNKHCHVRGKLGPLRSSAKFCTLFASVNCFQKEKTCKPKLILMEGKIGILLGSLHPLLVPDVAMIIGKQMSF